MRKLSQKDQLMLANLTTHDYAGRHFLERYPYDWLKRMESMGYITIIRPVHQQTGIPYAEEYWEVRVNLEIDEWFDVDGNLSVDGEPKYTTWGAIRGGCGHAHRTSEAARRCLSKDRRGCQAQGGYSDREIRYITSAAESKVYDVTRGPGQPIPIQAIE
jgi:hypothetical protein